ncbi:MAG: putative metal-binding motif-containing protein, partial [Gemmatimonadetes bacterium]|nr:putative metal-binding motif-containing protein [Gemmatimonadota bacterium]
MALASLHRPIPLLLLIVAVGLALPGAAAADHDGGAIPYNDSSQQAWPLSLNSTIENHENTGATVESGERLDCSGRGYRHTIWYYFDISSRGRVVVTVTGASLLVAGSFDSVISLQGATTGIGEAPLACNDDADDSAAGGSRITADLAPALYFVQVGGYDPDPTTLADPDIGRFSIEIRYTEDLDRDDDGSIRPADCNDDNPAVKPGATDQGVNGIDDNCDGVIDPDKDSDGYLARPAGNDCVDTPGSGAGIHPGAREVLGNNVDEDCDGKRSPFRRIGADTDYSFDYSLSGIRITSVFKLVSVPGGARSTVICRAANRRSCGRFGPTTKRSFPQLNGKRLGR